ncbi:uncharacterized protein LOC116620785 [Nematostella vectensis]|uniref:uncharacterized protein LOC116620785 n=1 Tax=Nematostella vectensis TaxID=45351 RepID=UPI0020772768|nr:uncharacterized protein LOC116620785 [Nematostella vectensis]
MFFCPKEFTIEQCFVGKRHLEEAIKSFTDVKFVVNWKPFFLNPSLPDDGVPLLDYLAGKYGAEAAEAALSSAGDSCRKVGIKFNPSPLMVKTIKAHCLIDYATTQNKQEAVAESLFHHFFELAHNISCEDVLQQVASESDLDTSAAIMHIQDQGVAARVMGEGLEARKTGISSVPFYSIVAKGCVTPVALSGVQSSDTFKEIFTKMLDQHI